MSFWDYCFMQLCGWLLHPGYQREGTYVPSLEEIAELCDRIEALRNKRCS